MLTCLTFRVPYSALADELGRVNRRIHETTEARRTWNIIACRNMRLDDDGVVCRATGGLSLLLFMKRDLLEERNDAGAASRRYGS